MLTQTRSLVPVLGHGMISGRVSGTRQGAISSVHGVLRRLSSDRVQTCALGGAPFARLASSHMARPPAGADGASA